MTLQAEQAKYAEVPKVLAQVESAKTAQETAMANDVLWYRYLNDLALTYPSEVWLENLTATVAGPGPEAAVPVAGTDPLATPGVGTIQFTGKALQHSDVASWLDVLDGTKGFADASFSSSTRTQVDEQDVVQFTSDAVVTGDALSHRFDRKAQ
jgi:Tfp pilus assembly protein PilN